jgi:hypothetical protein
MVLPPHEMSSSPINLDLIIPHSLPLPDTLLIIIQKSEVVNNVFFPHPSCKKKNSYFLDLNLIPSTFLKATSTIFIPLYHADLFGLG